MEPRLAMCRLPTTLIIGALAATLVSVPGPLAHAQSSGIYGGIGISTLGAGADIGYRFNDFFGVRLNVNYFEWDFDVDYGGLDYDLSANLASAGVLADYHPFGNGFHLTGGVYYNGNVFDVVAQPTGGTLTIGSTTYPAAAAGRVSGDVEFNDIAPYLGLGYDIALTDNLDFGVDAGLLFHGQADATLSSTGAVAAADLRAEEDDLEDALDDWIAYPVIWFRLIYRF